jgi:hypothetical protein
MACRRLLPFAVLLVCAAVPLSFADQVVYFVNGKAIMVKSVEKGDKFTILEMEGGGKVGVPTDQITKIEDFVVTAPVAPQAVPAQSAAVPPVVAPIVAAVPGPVMPQPAVASSLPASPTTVPGPGMGGKPAGSPNGNLAHVRPLNIGGGNDSGGPLQRPNPLAGAGPGAGGPGGPMLGMGARPSFAEGRRFGRGFNPGGRVGRPGMADPGRATPPQSAPGAPQSQATQPPPTPTPTPTVVPDPTPAPPDDSNNNDDPSDPNSPEQGDSSGNTPGSAS